MSRKPTQLQNMLLKIDHKMSFDLCDYNPTHTNMFSHSIFSSVQCSHRSLREVIHKIELCNILIERFRDTKTRTLTPNGFCGNEFTEFVVYKLKIMMPIIKLRHIIYVQIIYLVGVAKLKSSSLNISPMQTVFT